MIVCGIELKSNEAVVCLLSMADGLFNLPDCRASRITLQSTASREHLRQFQATFVKLMEDYKVDKVVIRERMQRGKFAGGAIGFKLEAAIQLAESLDVELLSPSDIKQALKDNPMPIHFPETGLKSFQEPAFTTAYARLIRASKK